MSRDATYLYLISECMHNIHTTGGLDAGCSVSTDMSTDTSVSVVLGLRWGVTLTPGYVKNKTPFGANSKNKIWREGCRRVLLCCSIAAVDGSRSQIADRCGELADE
eukprot:scaffold18130_cov119-Isochrysis_galbana.AAC.7